MPNKKYLNPDEYIMDFGADVQQVLQTVRQTIQNAVPDAVEVISYNIPAFNYKGWVFYYSAYKNHYTLSCPPPCIAFTAFAAELKPYEMSKSAIKFPYNQPIPIDLISNMAKLIAEENVKTFKTKK